MSWPTRESLKALLSRILPSFVFTSITEYSGKEIVQAQTAMVEYISSKLQRLFAQALLKDAESGEYATGRATLSWPDSLDVKLHFDALELTLYGIKNGGKNLVPYVNLKAIEIEPEDTSPLTIDVRAARMGMDQDILKKRLIRFARYQDYKSGSATILGVSGTYYITPDEGETAFTDADVGRVLKITVSNPVDQLPMLRRIASVAGGVATVTGIEGGPACSYQIADLNEYGLRIVNDADIIGGNFPMLEMHGQSLGLRMALDESDDQFKTKVKVSQDKISPNALKRSLKRIMKAHAKGYDAYFVDCFEGPETCAFASEFDDFAEDEEFDPLVGIFDDERDRPSTMLELAKSRGYFAVRVPSFDPLPDGITEADTMRIYNAVYQSMIKNRASEVIDFDLVFYDLE